MFIPLVQYCLYVIPFAIIIQMFFVNRYTYDEKGRITKLIVDWQGSEFTDQPPRQITRSFIYITNDGNLYKAGPYNLWNQYDDKSKFTADQ